MKKTVVLVLLLAILGMVIPSINFPAKVSAAYDANLLTGVQSTFEDTAVPSGWSAFGGGTLSTSATVSHSGSRSLKMENRSYSWTSPQFNIYSIIKNGGTGTYQITFWVYVDSLASNPGSGRIVIRGTSADQYSFLIAGQSFALLSEQVKTYANQWTQYIGTLSVNSTDDISGATGDFNIMIDSLEAAAGQNVYFDDITVCKCSDNLMGGSLGTFEQSTLPTGWSAFGGGNVSTSTTVAHSGSYSLKLAGRSQTWFSPAYNIYNVFKAGGVGTYYISLWVRVDSLTTSPGSGSLLIRGEAADDNSFINNYYGNYFATLQANISTTVNTWTQYTASLTVLASDLVRDTGTFYLCVDSIGLGTNQNLYIDDVQISKPATTVECWRSQEISFNSSYGDTLQYFTGTAGTFEDGTANGWSAFGGGAVAASATVAHSGSYSLKMADRSVSWQSPAYNIYNLLKMYGAGTYNISFWVYADALTSSPSDGAIIIRGDSAGQYSFFSTGSSYGAVSGLIATPVNTWVQYNGSVTVTAADISGATGNFNLMIDSLAGCSGQNLYIDDVSITAYPMTQYLSGTTGNFENGSLNGWTAFSGGTISASSAVKHSGSYSARLSGRTQSWYSPTMNIYSLLKEGGAGTYKISMWVYVDTLTTNPCDGRMLIRADSAGQYSFLDAGQAFGGISDYFSTSAGTWTQYSGSVTVTEEDISGTTGNFSLMIDTLGGAANQNLYIDDVSITGHPTIQYLTGAGTGDGGTFEGADTSGWSAFGGGTLSASTAVKHSGSYSVKLAGRTYSWYSPQTNIYNTIKNAGAGTYKISMWVYVDTLLTNPSNGRILIRSDSAGQYSFLDAGQAFAGISNNFSTATGTWTKYYGSLTVTEADISGATGNFSLMIDTLEGVGNQNLYIDDVKIYKTYSDPFMDINLNVTFTGPGGTTFVMPAFWDGGTTWKARFAPTKTGLWNYVTSCSNKEDKGLHGITGTIGCTAYSGNLTVYQKGFVRTASGTRYFTYDDGTPFFYIGDTHWSMPLEPYTTMFQPLVDKRITQGFTVYQSEPIGAYYNLSNGLTGADIAGFTDLDKRFQYVADSGLIHSNAELFFTDELSNNASSYSTAYLQKLSRYWVARYSSYPVMWSTAQEVDKDFHGLFDASTNPWKAVFNAIHTYDPYGHPQTAHQDNTDLVRASDSEFKNLTGYSFFAAQWAPVKNALPGFAVAKDYWNNSNSRPTVLYEGHYENLATNGFGARMQGWTAYLNGMYGQGYGVQDIWYTNTNMWEDTQDTIFGITITVPMKQVLWTTSQDFTAATELGTYMKNFFSSINWWQLTPRFDDTAYFTNNGSYYSVASILNDSYVAYFYNTTTNTGTLKGMDNTTYTAKWYNPRTGNYITIGNITPNNGQWTIPSKPDGNDWVLYVYHS